MKNPLKQKWAAGEPTLGAWLTVPSSITAEMMARLGFDWLTIDMQHGLIGYQAAVSMLQAISTTDTVAMVRVPWNEPGVIGKVLDAGAGGVVIPMVNSPAEAEAAVAACRYPPEGRRSFGPIRAALVEGRSYFADANREVCCMPMVETRQAVESLDDILAVAGIDGVYVGPNDLSLSFGLGPASDREDPEFREAIATILDGCRRHGVIAGCAGTAQTAAKRLAQGFLFVEVSRDGGAMQRGAAADLGQIRDVVRSEQVASSGVDDDAKRNGEEGASS